MGSIRLWITGIVVFCGGAVLAAILIPKSDLQSPVISVLGLVAIAVVVPLIRKIFEKKETPFSKTLGAKFATSNALLWSGLAMVIISFAWLFVGLGIVGVAAASPAIAFVPFVGLVTVGSLLISSRVIAWMYRLTDSKDL